LLRRPQKLCDFRWQRHVYRIAGFRASKKQRIVFIQANAFERDGVENGQTAPAHQQDKGQELLGSGMTVGAAVTVIGNGGQDLIELLACEAVGGSGFGNLRLLELQLKGCAAAIDVSDKTERSFEGPRVGAAL
jgi:hypothetical protein